MAFLIGGANSAVSGYDIENSYRFNAADEHNFARTPSSSGNRKTWTFSCWIKRASLSGSNYPRLLTTEGSDSISLNFMQEDTLRFQAASNHLITNMLFRDLSAWYHIVLAMDSAQGTAANRTKLYVNGTQVTSFGTENYVSQNEERAVMHTVNHELGRYADNEDNAFDGYMSEVAFVDGTAYAASAFGETDEDSGIWKPKKPSVTWGTNGAFLEFKQTGTSANASGMGADTSGNDNHWTPENLAATDQCTDSPTNNFATLRIAQSPQNAQAVLTEGNCDFDFTGGGSLSSRRLDNHCVSTIAMSAGKWYCEAKITEDANGFFAGVNNLSTKGEAAEIESWIALYGDNGQKYTQEYTGQSVANATHGAAVSLNNTIMIALDMDNKNVYFGNEGNWADGSGNFDESSPNSAISISDNFLTIVGDGSNVVFAFMGAGSSETPRFQVNFGNPVQTISSGNSDANGYGNFEFTVPTNYYALCTKNLAEFGG